MKIYNLIFILVIVGLMSITLVNANRLIVYDEESYNYAKWARAELRDSYPFNLVKWSIYYKQQVEPRQGDVIVEVKNIDGYGLAYTTQNNEAGRIIINPFSFSIVNQSFLLNHELGHVFGLPHSNDHSIMDTDGGDSSFREYQINIIKNNIIRGE